MPDSNDIQIQKLFIYDPAFSRTVADLYVGKTSQPERLFQKLIIVLDFPRRTSDDGALVDTVVRTAIKAFEESRQFTPELVLETTLESLNITLPNIAPKKHARWLDELSLLIGISDRGQVHFSQIGSIQAFLAQGTSMALVSENPGQLNPLKLFSHITSGILNPGDALLLTTEPLCDYISEDKVKNLIQRFPPDVAVQRLEALVSQVPSSITFAAVLIKFTTEFDELAVNGMEVPQMPRRAQAAQEPAAENDFDLQSDADARFDDMPRPRRTARPRGSRMPYISFAGAIRTFLKHAAVYLRLIGRILSQGAKILLRSLQALIFPSARARHERHLVAFTEQLFAQAQARYDAAPKKRRLIVIILCILCFLLLHTLLIKGQDRQLMATRSAYDTTLFALTQKKQAADDALLYGDEATAEQIYLDMIAALDGLKPANKKQEEQIAQYRKEAEYQLNKVRHINTIDSPLSLADISSIPEANLPGLTLGPDGSVILAADKQLYRLKDSVVTKMAALADPVSFIAQSGDTTLALTTTNNLFRIKGTDSSPVTLAQHADLQHVDALTLYAGNLYLLDRGKGELFKHEGSGTTFKAGTVWLNDAGLLNKANNVAIDGNAYLTTRDGDIIKLLKGARQEFNYHQFSPRLGASSTIYTTKESNLLYILDPENKRVAILDKQGNIKDQYTSSKFDALKSLAVNPQEDAIYVLNGKAIYLLAIKK